MVIVVLKAKENIITTCANTIDIDILQYYVPPKFARHVERVWFRTDEGGSDGLPTNYKHNKISIIYCYKLPTTLPRLEHLGKLKNESSSITKMTEFVIFANDPIV